MSDPDRSESRQSVTGTRVRGKIEQSSEATRASQRVEGGSAQEVKQSVRGRAELVLGSGYRARGTLAILALVVIVIGALVVRALTT